MVRIKVAEKHVGKKPKLTEGDLKRLRELPRFGVTKKQIAQLLGVSRTALYRYLRKVRSDK